MQIPHLLLCRLMLAAATFLPLPALALSTKAVDIVTGDGATTVERNIARILAERLSENTGIKAIVVPETARPTGAPRIRPHQPTVIELREHGRRFPPNYLHESWADYLYWDSVLEP